MSRGERGSGELDWDEPTRPHPTRKKTARTSEARLIVERMAWTGRPWVYWANLSRVESEPGPNWSDKLEGAQDVLARRLQRHAAGAYAVNLTVQPPEQAGRSEFDELARQPLFSDSLRRLNPVVTEISSLGEAIASGSHKLSESRRFPKAIPSLVGDAAEWRQKQELALRLAREVVDAAQQRSQEGKLTPALLLLESSCMWLGPEEQRPSTMLSSEELIEAATPARRGEAPPNWRLAVYALLGQRRVPRKPPAAYGGWYRCGKLLPAWPLDVLVHAARKLGGPHLLADQVEAEPELARTLVAALLRDLLLTASGPSRTQEPCLAPPIQDAMAALPALLSICKRLEAERARRLTGMMDVQRQAIEDAIGATGVSGEIVRFTAAAELDPYTTSRDEFWRCYFRNIAAVTGAPAVIPRKDALPAGTITDARRHLRQLHQLLSASWPGTKDAGISSDAPTGSLWRLDREGRRLLTRPRAPEAPSVPLTFENLADYASEVIWNAGEVSARSLAAESWQARFLFAAARSGCLTPAATTGVEQWADTCCMLRTPGPDGQKHLRVVVAGLVEVYQQAGRSRLDDEKRGMAFAILGRNAQQLLEGDGQPNRPLHKTGATGIRFMCAALAAGMEAAQIEQALKLNLVKPLEVLLGLDPRRIPALLELVERLVNSLSGENRENPVTNLKEWRLDDVSWGVAFALLNPAMINRYFDWARGPEVSPRPSYSSEGMETMRWFFGLLLPEDHEFDFGIVAVRAAHAAGHRRAMAAFLWRNSDQLMGRTDESWRPDRPVAAEFPQLSHRERLDCWLRCIEIACECADLGLGDPLAVFHRMVHEQCSSTDNTLFNNYSGRALRIYLRVGEGDPERLAVVGAARFDLSWDENEQVGKAWDCLELLGELRQFIARQAGQRDSTVRAVRWLSRLGFCLRLQGERRLREKLRAVWSPPAQNPGEAPSPLPADLNVPSECIDDVLRLLRLRGDGTLPKKVEDILRRRDDLAGELQGLEARSASLSPPALARMENLREKLANPQRLQEWIVDDLRDALPPQLFQELERIVRELTAGHLRKIIGQPPPLARDTGDEGRNWDNAARLYFSVTKNRNALKRLLWHEARGDRQWMRDFAPNRQCLIRMAGLGIDTDAWLGPLVRNAATPFGTWELDLETNPLEVLRMGNYFGTCLSEGHFNAFATVANACDANKRVVYVRDARGNVIGRKLLVMTPEGEILGFRSYGLGPLDPNDPSDSGSSPWMKVLLHSFCRELADRCHARLHPFPTVREGRGDATATDWLSLTTHWYNDGPEPFDAIWLNHSPADLRRQVAEKTPVFEALLRPLCDAGPDESLAASLRAIVFLNDDALGLLQAFIGLACAAAGDQPALQVSEARASYVLRYIARYGLPGALRELAEAALTEEGRT